MGYSPWGHKELDVTEHTHVYSWVLKRLEINLRGEWTQSDGYSHDSGSLCSR